MIIGGLGCGKAVSLPKPAYPQEAKAAKVSGRVVVSVIVGKEGNVESAEAISGHSLLHAAAEKAALASKYVPMTIKGIAVKVKGIIVYNFVSDENQKFAAADLKTENKNIVSISRSTRKSTRQTRIKKAHNLENKRVILIVPKFD